MQPGDGGISSQVLKATRRMDPKEQNAMVHCRNRRSVDHFKV
jgi:hypothetical protein